MYKAIIIDDEEMARILLKEMLQPLSNTLTVECLCPDLPSGVKAIKKYNPDIVFLDIDLPGHSGLELLDFFNEDEINFSIIFVTAYNQYAIQAFNMSAVSYLLKPVQMADLQNAVLLFEKNKHRQNLNTLKNNLDGHTPQKIGLNTLNSITFEELDNILYFQADGSYTRVILRSGNPVIVSRALKYFETLLTGHNDFVRCHKSYIVNLKHITEYIKADGGSLVVDKKHHVSVSPDKVDMILKKAAHYL